MIRMTVVIASICLVAGCKSASVKQGGADLSAQSESANPNLVLQVPPEEFENVQSYVADSQYDAAHGLLLELRESYPESEEVSINLAMSWRRLGDLELANQILNEVLDNNPSQVDAMTELGTNLLEQGDIAQAQKTLLQALKISPNNANLHYNLAVMYELYLQSFQRAITHYSKFIELLADPASADAKVVNQRIRLLERLSK